MWLGAFPLIIPALILRSRRKRALSSARFVGNLRTRIFHDRNCEYAQRIYSNFFKYPLNTSAEATQSGFRACNWCKPVDKK
ncbi:hypothetical protein JNK13_11220 [bacterium]|nr:hypothetical protein [bacterium]